MSALTSISRLVGFLLALVGLVMGAQIVGEYLEFHFAPPARRLELLWQQDIADLRAAGKLAKGWDDVKEIELIPATDTAKRLVKQLHVPIKLKTSGRHRMEILFLTWEEGAVEGAIIQHNLVELPSNNMTWELGRTYILKGDLSSVAASDEEVSTRIQSLSPKANPQGKSNLREK